MKQLRSRFRLISLLLVCAFLLTLAFCTGTALKTAGITLSSLPALPGIGAAGSPEPSVSADTSPSESPTPDPSEAAPEDSALPDTDISPEPDYNVYGL